MKYIIVRTNSLPEIKETDEKKFEEEIRNILGYDYEVLFSEKVEDGIITYIGSKEKEPRQPNRALHNWNEFNEIQGYIPSKVFIIYKKQNISLTDTELKTICDVYGKESIDYAKKMFT